MILTIRQIVVRVSKVYEIDFVMSQSRNLSHLTLS